MFFRCTSLRREGDRLVVILLLFMHFQASRKLYKIYNVPWVVESSSTRGCFQKCSQSVKKQNKKYNLSINRPTTKIEVNARRRTLHHSVLNYYNSKFIYRLKIQLLNKLYPMNSPPLFEERYIIEITALFLL